MKSIFKKSFLFYSLFVAILLIGNAHKAFAAVLSATHLSSAETYTEDTSLNLVDIVVTDDDSPTVTATLTLSSPVAGSLSTATSNAVTSTYNAGTGVWTASGALTDVNILLAGVTFVPALNYNSAFTIATSVSDGVDTTVTGTKTMTGTPVNDAPTATNINASETYTEDTTLNLIDIVVSDVDSATVTATLTLSDTGAGSLTTATSGSVTSTFSGGVWSASGAIANVNALLAGVSFVPTANYNSNFTITIIINDGSGGVTPGAKTMTGIPVNDAPILDATKSPTLASIATGSGAPVGAVGTSVSTLVDFTSPPGGLDNVTDADSGASLGIAITAVDTTDFTCYYSLNSGTTWSAIGAVSASSARLLAANGTNRVYCDPGATVAGTYGSALTIRAWDQTTGTDGATASTTSSGGTTAFSTATDTASITITGGGNHAPVAVDDNYSIDENSPGETLDVLANDTDADEDPLVITVVDTPGHGEVSTDGVTALYIPPANYCGGDSFSYTISDGTATDTGVAYITVGCVPPTVTEVTPLNDSTDQSTSVPISITFSLPMNTESLVVSSSPCNGDCPTYTQEWSNDNKTVTLTKSNGPFTAGTRYQITVESASSASEYSMDGSIWWFFTTVTAPSGGTVSGGGGTPWIPSVSLGGGQFQSATQSSKTAYHFSRLLRQGMKGDDIVTLQNFLKVPPTPFKFFGPKTKAMLIEYQKSHGLVPDGIAGPKTERVIEGAMN